MSAEEKLEAMGLTLPTPPKPLASYVPAVRTGNLVFTSGQIPTRDGTLTRAGVVGRDVTPDEAHDDAQQAALNALAAIRALVGSLDAIQRIVRVTGYVASADGFTDQPAVINGASDLLLELFGEHGQHSRAAIGVSQLPRNAPVEVDLIVEVRE